MMIPGEYFIRDGEIELNANRVPAALRVENTGDRPIQVGSHTHFFEVNAALRFDRGAAYGRRLDIAAGTSLRFEPGEARDVVLIPLAGRRVAFGMSGRVNGALEGTSAASEPRERSAPAPNQTTSRASDRVGEPEGQSPSDRK